MALPGDFHTHRIPFVRLLMPFLAGVIVALTPVKGMVYGMILLFGMGTGLLLFALTVRDPVVRYRRDPWGGAGILLLFLVAGWLGSSLLRREVTDKTALTGPACIRGYILRPASGHAASTKVLFRVEALRHAGRWLRVPGKAILYFPAESDVCHMTAGTSLLVRTTLRKISYYGNPGEFDYRRYMNDQGVFWQGYVAGKNWRRLEGRDKKTPVVLAGQVRESLVRLLQEQGLAGRRLAVTAALLAGERTYLDRETRTLFAASGTMHILAISGLHVGILYLVLMWLFSLAGESGALRYLRFPVILASLWGYAFLTGLTPSVVRAALMFSLFLAATTFHRRSNVYNTLAVAAFLMLAAWPLLLRDAAFQLSFLAVLGIVTFYPPLYAILRRGLPVVDRLWALVAVSVAAQAVTFPLTLHYFHRFPLLFPLTNLLVIPLVTLLLYGGLLFFLLHALPLAAAPLALFLDKVSGLLLAITTRAATLPHAVVEAVWIPPAGVFWLYLLIVAVSFLLLTRKPGVLLLVQGLLLLGLVGWTARRFRQETVCRLVVFHTPGGCSLLLSAGHQGVLLEDPSRKDDYYVANAAAFYGLRDVVKTENITAPGKDPGERLPAGIFLGKGFFRAGGITGYLLTDSTMHPLREKIRVDHLLFSGRKWWLVKEQLRTLDAGNIILTDRVSPYAARRIRESCPGRTVYEVRRDGPFIREERQTKIIRKSFPLLCNFYTFAPYSIQTNRPSTKKPQ